MNIDIFDMIIFFVLIIAVSFIIGLNVSNIMNDKIGKIAKKEQNTTIYLKLENGKLLKYNNTENFGVDDNYTYNYKPDKTGKIRETIIESDKSKPKLFLTQGYHTNPSDRCMVNTVANDKIRYPDYNDILRYEGPGCYQNLVQEKKKNIIKVKNPNIPKDKCNVYKPGTVNNMTTKVIGPTGEIVEQQIKYYLPHTYLSLAGSRNGMINPNGYPSIADLENTISVGEPADVDQIGSIPVNNYNGEPLPMGSLMMVPNYY